MEIWTLTASLALVQLAWSATIPDSLPSYQEHSDGAGLDSRICCGGGAQPCSCTATLIGDGTPYQYYKNEQVTDTVSNCEQATRSTTDTSGTTFTWGFSLTAGNSDGPFDWISGGFDVTESRSSGEALGCNSNAVENVCLWFQQAYTAYNVTYACTGACEAGIDGSTGIMKSPNSHNDGGEGYYCVVNTCQSKGATYFYEGAAGTAS